MHKLRGAVCHSRLPLGQCGPMMTKLASTVLVTVRADPSQVLQPNGTYGIQGTSLACNLHQQTFVWLQTGQLGDRLIPQHYIDQYRRYKHF